MKITEDLKELVAIALQEDLGTTGDITTQSTIDKDKVITASMISREVGVIAGIEVAQYVLNVIDENLNIELHVQDGEEVTSGQKILSVTGNAQSILKVERTALNFLTHLSGIATETARFVAAISHTNAKILDTRKTLPGWRLLQKHAVKMGGGQNHRIGLYDMVLIKDNHIAAAGGVVNALDKAKEKNSNIKIEIEVDTLKQLQEVIDHGTAEIVLLDNMCGEELKKAVNLIDRKIKAEASGGINIDTVREIAESGVDYISIGALTHSVTALDIGLDTD